MYNPEGMNNLTNNQVILVLVLLIWSVYWKYRAIWAAARAGHRNWYTLMIFINTLGILEIYYLKKIDPHKAKLL